jgi:hypothetical protein
VSLNPIPVSVWLAFGLLIVKLNEVIPFNGIVSAPNPSLTTGGDVTLRFAVAELPVTALDDVTAPVVFVKFPGNVARTFT